ncbi:TMEM175 family protein [Williamsia sterculiae]|uniref:Uncharacterized membrane protein n=1 Tax=Williamsia sterculiae TaxID=1344003 RepID=A0A1N7CDS6_9NOCA|nr:TMEM175 family protein [Williamsia sterculiae]SIR61742.1 Uncharacterized membrane protein [Williamsia sterculiae]
MTTGRLEAFSDGVLAIIITIMVLELKAPEGTRITDLGHATGTGLLTYLLSFVYVGIYWNNHQHTFQLTQKINGRVLWANLALLFFLSLLPFATTWMDDSEFARTPVVFYGVLLLLISLAYFVLQRVIKTAEGDDSALRVALGGDRKGKISVVLYIVGIVAALVVTAADAGVWIALSLFVVVAILWIIPDSRIDRYYNDQ